MIPWTNITMFGDSVVTLPAAVVVVIWLLAMRSVRLAFWWSLLFGLGLTAVLVSKLAFIGWGIGSDMLDFTGLSGHAMRASAVFPVLCYLAVLRSAPALRFAGVVLGVALGLLIGVSRVVLHYHSISEVVSGALLGSMVSFGFILIAADISRARLNRWLVALAMLVLYPTSHAEPAPTNGWLVSIALYLSGHEKPFTRESAWPSHSASLSAPSTTAVPLSRTE